MNWHIDDILNLIKEYNKKYFKGNIKLPFKVKWVRNYKDCEATLSPFKGGHHIIKINSSLYRASPALMKNTLVHELIHAWQAENDDCEPEWHNDSFKKWCDKLNATGDFRYPLDSTGTKKEWKELDQLFNSAYYVFRKTKKSTLGVFINFLYQEEINWLKNKGFSIKYYKNLKTTKESPIYLKTDEFCTHFINISEMIKVKITPQNIKSKIGKHKVFCNNEFNFKDGKDL